MNLSHAPGCLLAPRSCRDPSQGEARQAENSGTVSPESSANDFCAQPALWNICCLASLSQSLLSPPTSPVPCCWEYTLGREKREREEVFTHSFLLFRMSLRQNGKGRLLGRRAECERLSHKLLQRKCLQKHAFFPPLIADVLYLHECRTLARGQLSFSLARNRFFFFSMANPSVSLERGKDHMTRL